MKDLPLQVKVYVTVLFAVASGMFLYLVSLWEVGQFALLPFLLFIFLVAAAESMPVPMPQGVAVSVGFPLGVAVILLFQPAEAVVIIVSGYLFSFGKKAGWFKYMFNIAQFTFSSGAAVLVYHRLGSPDPGILTSNTAAILILTAFTYFAVNISLVSSVVALAQGENPYSFFLANIKWSVPNFLCMAPLGLLITLIYLHVGIWGLLLFFIPLLLARHAFKSYMDMKQSFLDTVESLTAAIDAKDPYTKGHSSRVADYAVAIANKLGYGADLQDKVRCLALLHDAGKIGVKEEILNKPLRLTKNEFAIIKRHPVVGGEIVKNIKMLPGGEKVIRHHHERFDGSGYPDGLVGQQIPEIARIITVVDSFDAMTSDRPYRRALTDTEAFEELRSCSGSQFDQHMVKLFTEIYPSVKLVEECGASIYKALTETTAAREQVAAASEQK